MNGVFKVALRLIIITAVAGLLLGLTYNITKEPIAQQEELAKSRARQTVLASADNFEAVDIEALGLSDEYSTVIEAYIGTADGSEVGATVTMVTKGYSSGLQVTVGITSDGTVSGVNIDAHSETPGLGAKAADASYLAQYKDSAAPFAIVKSPSDAAGDIEAVTGATLTSVGVCDAVNLACRLYAEHLS